MTINGRSKGHGFERETAKKLREVFPNAQRHLEYQQTDCRGFDLKGTGTLRIQCKRNRQYCSVRKIEEVQYSKGEIPVLITKGDRKRAIACLYLDDLIEILKDIGVVYENKD